MSSEETQIEDDPILTGLNPVQREAVLFGEGPLLVLAGAGSGKTRVLTRRIAHLILRREISPERVLAVTFTNKAAEEMRARVEALLGFDAAGLWIGTFHSICLRWIRRHADRLGFAGRVTVFDSDDSAAVLKEILRGLGTEAESFKVRDLQSVISLAKNRMWDPEDLEREWTRPDRHRLASIFRDYQSKLRQQNGVDFDDLLGLAVRLLEGQPEMGDTYARKFQHILVDEYQDTNHVQFRLVRRLAEGHGNIMVVGDDDQSIYGWRGADLSNILEFEKHYPKAHTLRMTQNYRSTGAILDLANAVIKNNRARKEKALWTDQGAGDLPLLHVAEDEEAEARWVINRIRLAAREVESSPGNAAILYRMHAQSRPLEEACLNLGVPYVLVGGVLFYQRREVKDLLAYLKLAVNPRDEVSFTRALAAPSRSLGKVSLERILVAAGATGVDLIQTCARLGSDSGIKGRSLEAVHAFAALMEELRTHLSAGPAAILRTVCEQTGFLEWLGGSAEEKADERVANVEELVRGAGHFEERTAERSVEAYLDTVALYTNLDTRNWQGERVTLMTVHNAKGLEFDSVFLTGLEEGVFPHASAFDNPVELEEERRLFYVAVTRAKNRLYLTASLERRRMNHLGGLGLSRFLDEIPAGLRQADSFSRSEHRSLFRPPRQASGGGFSRPGWRGADESSDGVTRSPAAWRGRQIVHAIFGVGQVEAEDGEGPDARLSIVFPQVGRKKVQARFVRPATSLD